MGGGAFLGVDQEGHMPTSDQDDRPAQVPGDAESPPKSEEDRTVKENVKHAESVACAQPDAGKNH